MSASVRELQRLVALIKAFAPTVGDGGRISQQETAYLLDAVVALVRHIITMPDAKTVFLDRLGYVQRTAASEEVSELNARLTKAMQQLAEEIRRSPAAWSLYEPEPQHRWINPWDPLGAIAQKWLTTGEFLEQLATRAHSGNSIEVARTALSILTGDSAGLNGILPDLLARDQSLEAKIGPLFDETSTCLSRLRTLFEFEPRFNGADAAQKLLAIFAPTHPELQGVGSRGDRMAYQMYRKDGMPPDRAHEMREFCAQIEYQILLALESPATNSQQILAPTEHAPELAVRAALPQPNSQDISAIAAGLAGTSNGQNVIQARERFNVAWREHFGASSTPLHAEETVVAAIFSPVSEASNLAFSLGSLTVLAFDGGLDQRALDEVAKRNKEERCLKHMERILQEKSGLESDEAQKRMEPFHLLQKLRNGHLPFHNPNEDGKKAFASIGHPLPVQNPSVCWDAICDLYVKALDAITDALAQSLTKPNDSIANEVVSDAN